MVLRDVTERARLENTLEHAPPASDVNAEPEFLGQHDFSALYDEPAAPATAATPVDPAQLREMEAALTQICGQARSAFQSLEDGLRDAGAQHDAALARQQEIYAQLETAHRERWQSYEAFVGSAALGIFQIDGEGRIVEANAALAHALGYDTPAAVITAADAMPSLTEPGAWAHAVGTWLGAAPNSAIVDTRWKRRDGTLATLRLTGRCRQTSDGGPTRIEVVAEDLSAQRGLEALVRRGRRWEDVARLTTGLASDLRGVVEDMNEPARGTTLEAAVARAADLSRQLVAFGRREARSAEPVDVNAVVRGVEDVMRRLVDDHIELTLDLAPALELIEGERPVLEEALVNLAVAAGDTLPAGGRLRLVTSSQDDHVVLALTAQGWGAATPDAGDSAALASAQRAVARLGGSLTADTVSDESLTLTVHLPQASVAILTDDSESAAGPVAARL
jgi:PAS domain S-box-containing protein